MKKIIHFTPVFGVIALLFVLTFSSCGSDKKENDFVSDIDKIVNLTYVNIEFVAFAPTSHEELFGVIKPTTSDFLNSDAKHGIVPAITVKNANNSKLVYEVTHQLTKEEMNMAKYEVPKTHRTHLSEMINAAHLPDAFNQSFVLSTEKVQAYCEQIQKISSEKTIITFNPNLTEGDTSVMAHTSEELKSKMIDAIVEGKTHLIVYYNIVMPAPIDTESLKIVNIEVANAKAVLIKDKTQRKAELSKIETAIGLELAKKPESITLWFERAVNKSHADDFKNAILYLQMAAKIAISNGSDSSFTLKSKLEIEGTTKLRSFIINRKPEYDAVLNGLTHNDIDLSTCPTGVPQKLASGDYLLYLNSTNDTYKNSKNGNQVSTLSRDAEGNATIKLLLPDKPGATMVREITPTGGRLLRFSEVLSNTYGGWTYSIINESPANKNYIKLRIKFEYIEPESDWDK